MAERHDSGDRPGWTASTLGALPPRQGLGRAASTTFLEHVEGPIWTRPRTKKLAAKYAEAGFVPADDNTNWMTRR